MNRCSACLLAVTLVAAGAPSVLASDVVFTKQARFRIPYHSEPAELQRLGAREIQLYVSSDRGLSWKLAQSVSPTAGRFAYEAPGDGEYWFAVRTLDGLGRLHPQTGEITPGLKVAVDSQPPQLAISLDRVGDQARVSWQASDTHLNPATLKLEYRNSPSDVWQPLSVAGQSSGQTSLKSPGKMQVRGTIADHSGNTGSDDAELDSTASGYAPLPDNPELEGPIASYLGEPADTPFHMASSRMESAPEQLASNSNRFPITSGNAAAGSKPQPVTAPKPQAMQPPAAASNVPNTARQELVNTRSFNVGYQVDDVGPSGLGGVEFFITEDGGQRWYRYGADSDKKSPFRIDVPAEGTYGFRVRALSGVGLASEPPKAGERPAVTVVVDQTPPVATVQVPAQSSGKSAPVLQVRWKVQDTHPLQAKSIDLAHGPSPEGPWTPIVSELDDRGGFDWIVTSIPAAKLFIRLTARDAAGNAGHAVTQQPVTVDTKLPSARITDIEIQPLK